MRYVSSVVSTTVKYIPENAPRNTDTRISGSLSTSCAAAERRVGQHVEVVEPGPADGGRLGDRRGSRSR